MPVLKKESYQAIYFRVTEMLWPLGKYDGRRPKYLITMKAKQKHFIWLLEKNVYMLICSECFYQENFWIIAKNDWKRAWLNALSLK